MGNVERIEALLIQGEQWRALAEMNAPRLAVALDAAGVFLPPEGADKSEGRVVSLDPNQSNPWADTEIENRNGRMIVWQTGLDVTEAYHEWLGSLEGTISVTFEWPEPLPICPDCRDGKHGACGGQALHELLDVIVDCRCDHA